MNPSFRYHLLHLDRALLALLDERARLVASCETPASARPAVEDLMRRRDGPVGADSVRAFFEAVDAACCEVRP